MEDSAVLPQDRKLRIFVRIGKCSQNAGFYTRPREVMYRGCGTKLVRQPLFEKRENKIFIVYCVKTSEIDAVILYNEL